MLLNSDAKISQGTISAIFFIKTFMIRIFWRINVEEKYVNTTSYKPVQG